MKEKNREPNLIIFSKQTYNSLEKDVVSVVVNNLKTGINVQPELFEKNIKITISAKMLSVSMKNFYRLKTVADTLTSKKIAIINDEEEEFEFIVPFPKIKYSRGVLEITMFADVLPHFLELKAGYTEYYLQESLSLKGFKTKRLYELFSSQKKYNPIWSISDNKLMELLDISAKSYKGRPTKFEKHHILPNLEEVNQKTRLDVTVTDRGKDADGWYTTFRIMEKKSETEEEREVPHQELDSKSQRAWEILTKLLVRKDFVKQIVMKEQLQKDFWNWHYQNKTNIEKKKFRNPAAVLLVHLGLVEPKF